MTRKILNIQNLSCHKYDAFLSLLLMRITGNKQFTNRLQKKGEEYNMIYYELLILALVAYIFYRSAEHSPLVTLAHSPAPNSHHWFC